MWLFDTKKEETTMPYESPSEEIDARIEELGERRGEMLSRIRDLIKKADPDVAEDVKWRKPSNSGLP